MGTPGPWRCKVEVASEQLVPGKPHRGTVCRRQILEEPLSGRSSAEVEAQGPWDACSHLAPTAEPVFHAGLLMPRQSCDPARHTPSSPRITSGPWTSRPPRAGTSRPVLWEEGPALGSSGREAAGWRRVPRWVLTRSLGSAEPPSPRPQAPHVAPSLKGNISSAMGRWSPV